ncbi:MAG: repressor LexA [Candidatus Harrisonbacteria bacterium]|nr:repressor LexA [Candidatus Harrisonbacteria bacterium]
MKRLLLTKNQKQILHFIKSQIQLKGSAPTIAEMRSKFGYASPRSVTQYLISLEKKGLIKRGRYAIRGIEVVAPIEYAGESVEIPVIASAGCDNMSVFAEQGFGDYICVPKSLLHGFRQENIVCLRAMGDSMDEAGINDSDCVLTEMTSEVANGDIVVAVVDGFGVIKRIEMANNAIILHPVSKNPTYRPIIVNKNIKIFGRVIDVLREPRQGGSEIEIVPLYPALD